MLSLVTLYHFFLFQVRAGLANVERTAVQCRARTGVENRSICLYPVVQASGRTSILPDCSTLRSQSAQLGNLFLTQPPFYHTWHKAIQRNLRLVFWQPPFYHTGVGSQCENFDSKEINFLSPLSIFVYGPIYSFIWTYSFTNAPKQTVLSLH